MSDQFRDLVESIVRDVLAQQGRPANDELLTTAEAAKQAKVTAATVRRWVRTKKLPRHGPGQVRVRRDELERFLMTGKAANLSPAERAKRKLGA
jgi:excisionase family DNA binding protein